MWLLRFLHTFDIKFSDIIQIICIQLYDFKYSYLIIIWFVKWLESSPMAWETGVQSQVKSYQRLKKWYLMPPCLTLSIIRYVSRVKWSNPEKGVALSPTPRCSRY